MSASPQCWIKSSPTLALSAGPRRRTRGTRPVQSKIVEAVPAGITPPSARM